MLELENYHYAGDCTINKVQFTEGQSSLSVPVLLNWDQLQVGCETAEGPEELRPKETHVF